MTSESISLEVQTTASTKETHANGEALLSKVTNGVIILVVCVNMTLAVVIVCIVLYRRKCKPPENPKRTPSVNEHGCTMTGYKRFRKSMSVFENAFNPTRRFSQMLPFHSDGRLRNKAINAEHQYDGKTEPTKVLRTFQCLNETFSEPDNGSVDSIEVLISPQTTHQTLEYSTETLADTYSNHFNRNQCTKPERAFHTFSRYRATPRECMTPERAYHTFSRSIGNLTNPYTKSSVNSEYITSRIPLNIPKDSKESVAETSRIDIDNTELVRSQINIQTFPINEAFAEPLRNHVDRIENRKPPKALKPFQRSTETLSESHNTDKNDVMTLRQALNKFKHLDETLVRIHNKKPMTQMTVQRKLQSSDDKIATTTSVSVDNSNTKSPWEASCNIKHEEMKLEPACTSSIGNNPISLPKKATIQTVHSSKETFTEIDNNNENNDTMTSKQLLHKMRDSDELIVGDYTCNHFVDNQNSVTEQTVNNTFQLSNERLTETSEKSNMSEVDHIMINSREELNNVQCSKVSMNISSSTSAYNTELGRLPTAQEELQRSNEDSFETSTTKDDNNKIVLSQNDLQKFKHKPLQDHFTDTVYNDQHKVPRSGIREFHGSNETLSENSRTKVQDTRNLTTRTAFHGFPHSNKDTNIENNSDKFKMFAKEFETAEKRTVEANDLTEPIKIINTYQPFKEKSFENKDRHVKEIEILMNQTPEAKSTCFDKNIVTPHYGAKQAHIREIPFDAFKTSDENWQKTSPCLEITRFNELDNTDLILRKKNTENKLADLPWFSKHSKTSSIHRSNEETNECHEYEEPYDENGPFVNPNWHNSILQRNKHDSHKQEATIPEEIHDYESVDDHRVSSLAGPHRLRANEKVKSEIHDYDEPYEVLTLLASAKNIEDYELLTLLRRSEEKFRLSANEMLEARRNLPVFNNKFVHVLPALPRDHEQLTLAELRRELRNRKLHNPTSDEYCDMSSTAFQIGKHIKENSNNGNDENCEPSYFDMSGLQNMKINANRTLVDSSCVKIDEDIQPKKSIWEYCDIQKKVPKILPRSVIKPQSVNTTCTSEHKLGVNDNPNKIECVQSATTLESKLNVIQVQTSEHKSESKEERNFVEIVPIRVNAGKQKESTNTVDDCSKQLCFSNNQPCHKEVRSMKYVSNNVETMPTLSTFKIKKLKNQESS